MCFVDGDETHLHMAQLGLKQTTAQPFGRHIENFGTSQNTVFQDAQHLLVRHTAVNGSSLDTQLAQVVHLVLHEGNEWCDDYTNTLLSQSWYLEGNAFAATRRHQSKRIVTSTNGLDDFALNAAKIIIAPISFKNELILITHRLSLITLLTD